MSFSIGVVVLIALSISYGLVAYGASALFGAFHDYLGAWELVLWLVAVPFAFGWAARGAMDRRVAHPTLLAFLAPALVWTVVYLAVRAAGGTRDDIGLEANVLLLAPHMVFAAAGCAFRKRSVRGSGGQWAAAHRRAVGQWNPITRWRRFITAICASLVGLPTLFLLFSILAWHLIRPRPAAIGESDLPGNFPLLVYWRDNQGPRCEAFVYSEFAEYATRIDSPAFSVPKAHEWVCESAFRRYTTTGHWPDRFGPGRGAKFEIKRNDQGRDEVHVSYDIDNDPNESWYSVSPGATDLTSGKYWRYNGLMLGVGVASMSAAVALLTYVVAAAIWVSRGRRGSAVQQANGAAAPPG